MASPSISSNALRELTRLAARGVATNGDADEFIQSALSTMGSVGFIVAEEHSFSGWNRHQGVPRVWLDSYASVRKGDPSIALLDRAEWGHSFFVNRDSTADEKRDPIYLLLQDVGLADGAIFRVPAPLGRELTLVFYRERGARPFGASDEAKLRLIYPHVAAALGTRSALLAFGGASTETLDELLEANQPHALVSLSREQATWSKSGLALVRGKLGHLGRSGAEKLDRALLRLAREFGVRPHTHLEAAFLPGVRVEFARLPSTKRSPADVLALFFEEGADESSHDLTARNAVEELLTSAERRVARAAAAGRSTRQIGRSLRVGVETVRTHLKHIYLKLGVRTRAELARALAG